MELKMDSYSAYLTVPPYLTVWANQDKVGSRSATRSSYWESYKIGLTGGRIDPIMAHYTVVGRVLSLAEELKRVGLDTLSAL